MSVSVRIPTILRTYTGGESEVSATGANLAEVLDDLDANFSGIKGRILDEVVSVTGWSRDNARRRLTSAAQSPPGAGRSVATRPRQQRATKFSYDAVQVLQRVWAASGGQCGKYLAASMRMQLDGLERHGELVDGVGRYSMAVRNNLTKSAPVQPIS